MIAKANARTRNGKELAKKKKNGREWRQQVCTGCPHRCRGYLSGDPHIGCDLMNPVWLPTATAKKCIVSTPRLAEFRDRFPNLERLVLEPPPSPE